MNLCRIALVSLAIVQGFAQSPKSGPRTERFTGGKFEIGNTTLKEMLPFAFLVRPAAIRGGPDWIGRDRFDIIAGVPPDASEQRLSMMLRAMLIKEFHLVFHEEPCQLSGFTLSVAKGGPKLKLSEPGAPSCQRGPDFLDCKHVKISDLIPRLSFVANDYIDQSVIVDKTGLDGVYDLRLQWSPRVAADAGQGDTLYSAMTDQAGLRLETGKVQASCLVVDSATVFK